MASYSAKAAFTAGIWTAFEKPPEPPNPMQYEVMATEAIADAFMTMDANYQSVPPAQSMRIINFKPQPLSFGRSPWLPPCRPSQFFADNTDDKNQWEGYASILGYSDVETMLNAYFKGNLIAEWDEIFYTGYRTARLREDRLQNHIVGVLHRLLQRDEVQGRRARDAPESDGHRDQEAKRASLQLKLSISDKKFKKLEEYITFESRI
jgi:hypothetical protein